MHIISWKLAYELFFFQDNGAVALSQVLDLGVWDGIWTAVGIVLNISQDQLLVPRCVDSEDFYRCSILQSLFESGV